MGKNKVDKKARRAECRKLIRALVAAGVLVRVR
jgi:hypothetical protein